MGLLKKEEEELEQPGEDSKEAILYVNGVRRVLPDSLAHLTLLEYLRGLTGTKLGCGEGGCGACIVMVSHYDKELKKSFHYAVNACLAPLYSVEGMHIITVEGLGSHMQGLHPIKIEGAFVQGLGWVALEELKWGDPAHKWISPGCLYTSGPGNYKIPSINDVPFKFSVSLLKGHPNVKAIHSSKAVGEPPFFLASAVFFAIKDAIIAARAEVGSNEWFPLDNPATPERIRMACLDEIIEPFVSTDFRAKLSV